LKLVNLCHYCCYEPQCLDSWIVSSVVPSLEPVISQAGEKYSHCSVFFVPRDIDLPLHNYYAHPEEVGADRLVTAYAARKLYSSPGIIVIDFGTATTLECVQDWGYLGGLICPGMLSSLQALGGQTAKLPKISLEVSSKGLEIGVSTVTSMNNGFIFGFSSMIEGLCQHLIEKLSGEVLVVATGGFAQKVKSICSAIDVVCDDLLLQGLLMAYEELLTKDPATMKH
jgi:type III pantothenate kinase